jgi:hypothetical protein
MFYDVGSDSSKPKQMRRGNMGFVTRFCNIIEQNSRVDKPLALYRGMRSFELIQGCFSPFHLFSSRCFWSRRRSVVVEAGVIFSTRKSKYVHYSWWLGAFVSGAS